MNDVVPAGTWVEIERVLLRPGERAPGLPEDTAACPYLLRTHGFLAEDSMLGYQVTVRSLIGREHSGILREANPSYQHSFGPTVPELLRIGLRGPS
jgi:hypothetical protein